MMEMKLDEANVHASIKTKSSCEMFLMRAYLRREHWKHFNQKQNIAYSLTFAIYKSSVPNALFRSRQSFIIKKKQSQQYIYNRPGDY